MAGYGAVETGLGAWPLTAEQLAVVHALVRDAATTSGIVNEAHITAYLVHEGHEAVRLGLVTTLDSFRQRLVEGFQQRMHDEFIDVSWPRCPRHPHHPLWLADGAWRCAQDDVAVAELGALDASTRERA